MVLHLIVLWPATIAHGMTQVVTPGETSVAIDISTDDDTTVEVKYGKDGLSNTETDTTSRQSHTITLRSLIPGTTYLYRIYTDDGVKSPIGYPQSGSDYLIKTLDDTPPHKLSGLASSSAERTSVDLSWDASLDVDTKEYNIYRDGNVVGTNDDTSYTDTGLQGGTYYYYQVSSIDRGGNEGPLSDQLGVTTEESDTSPPDFIGLGLTSVSKVSAVVGWNSGEDANATLLYGTSYDHLIFTKTSKAFQTEHAITLDTLVDATTYYYKVISCDESGNCAASSTKSFTAGSDAVPPTIEVTIPEYYNGLEMDIIGTTEPLAQIYLYVNGHLSAFKATDNTGKFTLRAVGFRTTAPNDLKLEAEDQSGNKATSTHTVLVDLKKPTIDMAELPSITAQNPLIMNGTVDENVKIKYKVGDALEKEISASNKFSFKLDLKEGVNAVSIKIVDNAGNAHEVSKDVLLDTVPPVIEEPTDLSYYSPAYTPGIMIYGKVDTPGSTVIVLVNGESSAGRTIPTSISGIVELFQQRGSTYTDVADEEGRFEIAIMLSRVGYTDGNLSRVGLQPGEVGGRGIAGTSGFGDIAGEDYTVNQIEIVAVDPSGLRSKPLEGVIRYGVCGTGGAWQVNIKDMSPTVIKAEHLMRGIARFGFNAELKYQGLGDNPSVESKPRLNPYQTSQSSQESTRGDILTSTASQLMKSTPSTSTSNYEMNHFLIDLKKWPGTYEELEDISFLKFPMMLEFRYTHEIFGRSKTETQKQCIDVIIQLEKPLDEGKIPEQFLKESVKLLDQAVKNLEDAIGYLEEIQTYLLWACMGSWVVLFLKDVFTDIKCLQSKRENVVAEVGKMVDWPDVYSDKGCDKEEKPEKCKSCAESKKTSRDWKEASHYLCDRVFCPSAPSLEHHAATYKDPLLGGTGPLKMNSACEDQTRGGYEPTAGGSTRAVDESRTVGASVDRTVSGDYLFGGEEETQMTLVDENLDPIQQDTTSADSFAQQTVTAQKGCKTEYKREWDSSCLLMNEWKEATKPLKDKPGFFDALLGTSGLCTEKTDSGARSVVTTVGGERKVYVKEDGKLYATGEAAGGGKIDGDEAFAVSDTSKFKKTGTPLVAKWDTEKNKVADPYLYEDTDGDGQWSEGDVQTKQKHNSQILRETNKPKKYVVNPQKAY